MNKKILAGIVILLLAVAVFVFIKKNGNETDDNPVKTPAGPANISYSIINTFPHDISSYTQGLIVYKNAMYEGTGNYGESKLLKIDPKTWKVEKQVSLDSIYFGEGVTILHDTVFQLTWKEKKVFLYDAKDLKKIKEFPVDIEGWGLTTDGKSLIATNGSDNLYFYEPSTFKLLHTESVIEAGSPAYNLNELEYIDGFIYANQYQLPYILKIDPNNGLVVGKTDLTDLWNRVKVKAPKSDVPNGIAYDSVANKIYITGKWWPELYEVQFSK